ncbi:hypothetical protein QYE76_019018 [Lolium multiflorum]|uniref:CCHC-type domain-containing protein n=1 Tax=Lolium multiflorum TaxID=4521 RepID=A0AAD8QDT6_LOLMU|nr:hypothetical protein QYE76_019018 [Lolium multiflorum]
MPLNDKKKKRTCYNCDEDSHFANKCPYEKRAVKFIKGQARLKPNQSMTDTRGTRRRAFVGAKYLSDEEEEDEEKEPEWRLKPSSALQEEPRYKKEKPAQEKNKKVTNDGKAPEGKATSGDRTGPNNHYALVVDYYGDVYANYVGPRNGYAYRGYLWGYSYGGPKWVFDSGCTNHMTGGRGVRDQFIEDINKKSSITFGDNSKGKVLGVFLLKSKDETHMEFITFAKKAHRMYEIKAIGTDNGTEFKNYTITRLLMMRHQAGFQVRQLTKGTFISQEKYVKDMLKKFNMTNASPMKTPMPVKGQLGSCDGEKDVDIKVVGVVRVRHVAMPPREEGLILLAVLVTAFPLQLSRVLTVAAQLGVEPSLLLPSTRISMLPMRMMRVRKIDGCDLIYCELKRAVMDRMTPNYAQYVQRLINYIVPAPRNVIGEKVIMDAFKIPTQEATRPDVPSMMPTAERRSKEHHDHDASSSYSRRPKHGAARFFSSMWQMCKNTNDVAHQSLALNQETRRRQNEFMATRNVPVPPPGPELAPVVAPQWEMPPITDEMIQNFDFSMYAHGGLPPRTARTPTPPPAMMVMVMRMKLIRLPVMMTRAPTPPGMSSIDGPVQPGQPPIRAGFRSSGNQFQWRARQIRFAAQVSKPLTGGSALRPIGKANRGSSRPA